MSDPAHGEQSARCRESACCVCSRAGRQQASRTEAHHEPTVGHLRTVVTERSEMDRYTVPLCHDCHMRRHTVGAVTFWAEAGIDPSAVLERMRQPFAILDAWEHVPF